MTYNLPEAFRRASFPAAITAMQFTTVGAAHEPSILQALNFIVTFGSAVWAFREFANGLETPVKAAAPKPADPSV